MIQKFFKHSGLYIISNFITRGISLLFLPVYTNLLTPAEYGIVETLSIAGVLLTLIAPFEITQAVVIFLSDSRSKLAKSIFISTSFWFVLISYSVISFVILLFLRPISFALFDQSDTEIYLGLGLLAGVANGLFYYFLNNLRWAGKATKNVICNIVYASVITLASILLVAWYKMGIVGVLLSNISAACVGAFLAWVFYRESYLLIFSKKRLYKMLHFSLPLVPSSISVFLCLFVDRIIVKEFLSLHHLGIYSVALKFASILTMVFSGFQFALSPLLYQHYKEKDTPAKVANMFIYFLCFSFLLQIGLSIYIKEILIIFTGKQYFEAWKIIPIMSASIIFSTLYIFSPGLSLKKKTKYLAFINLFSAAINILLNYLFIYYYQLLGAAIGTLLGAIISASLNIYAGIRFYYIPFKWKKIISFLLFSLFINSMIYYFISWQNDFNVLYILAKGIAFIFISFIFLLFFLDFKMIKNKLLEIIKKNRTS